VRSAIGFDQKRGDQVEVVNLRFAEAPVVPPVVEPTGLLGMLQFTKDDVMYVIELGVMMLLGLVVLFMVFRPLVKRILAAEVIPAPPEPALALTDGSAELGPGQALIAGTSGTAQLIDVAQVQARFTRRPCTGSANWPNAIRTRPPPCVRQWLSEPAES
jgi:flagellar M-ring protein FliF